MMKLQLEPARLHPSCSLLLPVKIPTAVLKADVICYSLLMLSDGVAIKVDEF